MVNDKLLKLSQHYDFFYQQHYDIKHTNNYKRIILSH